MAKARQIVKRRKAVTNIRKITRTMQLIANAQFQQAFKRATATKPYTKKIGELVRDLSQSAGGAVDHPLLRENPEAAKDVMIVLTSNRGLCGGYNGAILRTAVAHLNAPGALPTDLFVVGKKGVSYFRFLGRPMAERITHITEKPRFDQVEPIAVRMMDAYTAGTYRTVRVVYMKFISTGRQVPEVLQLLPLRSAETNESGGEPSDAAGARRHEYECSPAPAELLARLLPQSVKVRLFQCFTDAAVSEQVARMVAMKSATEAAEDMIKLLTRRYNRARQTQITMELLDIVGGAESLK
ncbi:MAG: ATP synthase F1 subunit gamma [Phycisphaerae bacterium]|nr:ATP synthase F1 subunit gamma [Phycisphaerae bacterium]